MIGENLLTLRKLHKMSQEDVAERIHVSRQAVAKWESGDTTPDINNCAALARLYDVSVDDLINYSQKSADLPLPPKGKYMFGTVTIGEKGQIVIPKKARDVFGLKPGDDVVVLGDEEQGLGLMKASIMLEMFNQFNITGKEEE